MCAPVLLPLGTRGHAHLFPMEGKWVSWYVDVALHTSLQGVCKGNAKAKSLL